MLRGSNSEPFHTGLTVSLEIPRIPTSGALMIGVKPCPQLLCLIDRGYKKLHNVSGEATSDEMCIAIVQYYPRQANASTHCWGYIYNEDIQLTECGFLVISFFFQLYFK